MESALGYHEQNAMAADMSFRPFCTNNLGYSQKNNPYKREFMRVMGQPAVWSCHYLLKDIFLMNAQAIGFQYINISAKEVSVKQQILLFIPRFKGLLLVQWSYYCEFL